MKKVGLLIFGLALTLGIIFSNSLGFGRFNLIRFGSLQGSGNTIAVTRDVSNFTKIDASGAVNVEVTFQKDFSVSIEADDNLLENVITAMDGDTLRVYTKGRFSTSNPAFVRITMPEIAGLDISGASTATVVNIISDSLEVEANGASKIKLTGEVKMLSLETNGACKIDAEKLKVENAKLEATGASNINISVFGELDAEANGASRIVYFGTPASIKKSVSGASSIIGK